MKANETVLGTLMQSPLCGDFMAAFSQTTGLPVTLRPVETWQLPLHGKPRENGWCALMAQKSHTCAGCLQTQEKLAQAGRDHACTVTCPYGLSECAVPVKVDGQTVGFLQTGQVLRHKQTPASFARAVSHAAELGVNLDPATARAAFFATPVVSPPKLSAVNGLLATFADHLSILGHQVQVQTSLAEPPLISRAKQFIRDHHTEDLSLGRVAAAVHTSLFHLCKLFRRVTGVTFTEFVSRIRVDKARNLLLNPNLRVGEIAYEVGFQSLTHFNRVFKKVMGESPTNYRRRLPRMLA